MNNTLHNSLYALVMLFTGLGIPVMAALNSGLGAKLQSPILATTILFVVASSTSLGILILLGNPPRFELHHSIPIYYYFGGFLVIFYILGVTYIAPKFGVGNTIAFVLLGQLIAMTAIDHYGIFGAQQNPVTAHRIAGLTLMITGVFLVVRRF